MPHTSGNVNVFANKVVSDNFGDPDGSTTVFSLQLTKAPCFINSLSITHTVASSDNSDGSSDSAGAITGTNIASGSIAEDGTLNLTFTTAPDNGTNIVVSYTAKGFLQKLIDFVAGDKFEETLDTGDGVQTSFPFTPGNANISKGNARLEFTVGATKYQVYDDGQGEFVHDLISSSSLSYAGGASNVTFTTPPDDTSDIKLLYCVGQNGGEDGRDWLLLLDQTSRSLNGTTETFPGQLLKEIILRNSGKNFQESIFVGFREWENTGSNQFGVNLLGLRTYEDDSVWQHERISLDLDSFSNNNWSQLPEILTNDDEELFYEISATKNKIMGYVRTSGTIYDPFYLGIGLRYSSPENYTQPLVVVGSAHGNLAVSSTSNDRKYIADPSLSTTDGNSYVVGVNNEYIKGNKATFHPMESFTNSGILSTDTEGKARPYPIVIVDEDSKLDLMQLEGVFVYPAETIRAEDTTVFNGDTYVVVQDVFRTEYHSFIIMRRES